jgi:hypothetical protein
VNQCIQAFWGPEFLLGHSYILGVEDADTLIEACNETILPQLAELYRDRPDDLSRILGASDEESAEDYALAERPDRSASPGVDDSLAVPLEIFDLRNDSKEDAIRRLYWLGYGKPWQRQTATAAPAAAPPPAPPGTGIDPTSGSAPA